jgi:hypothetical protein
VYVAPSAVSATYTVYLIPGTYTASYVGTSDFGCNARLPCNTGPLKTGVSLSSNGTLGLDIHTVAITGNITLSGAGLPASPTGQLAFAIGKAAPVAVPLAPLYSLRLLAGTYTISYAGQSTSCAGPFPCNSGVVKDGVSLTANGNVDVDIPAISVTGSVTLGKAPMPTMTLPRGDIGFALNGGTMGRSDSLGSTGAAGYAVTVLAGRYILVYDGNSQLCSPAMPGSPPCTNEILAGCP